MPLTEMASNLTFQERAPFLIRLIRFLLLLFVPFWGLLIPLMFMLYSSRVLLFSGHSLLYATALASIPLGALFTYFITKDNTVVVSPYGFHICPSYRTAKRLVPWTSIGTLSVYLEKTDFGGIKISLALNSTSNRPLFLYGEMEDLVSLDCFLSLLELRCAHAISQETMTRSKEFVANHTKSPLVSSYTTLWIQELESSYSQIAFEVLSNGTTLDNGRLRIVRNLSFGGFSVVYLAQSADGNLVTPKRFCVSQFLRWTL